MSYTATISFRTFCNMEGEVPAQARICGLIAVNQMTFRYMFIGENTYQVQEEFPLGARCTWKAYAQIS